MDKRSAITNRLLVIFGVMMLLPVAIVLQQVRILTGEGPKLRRLWNAQAIDFVPIPAQRGHIYDRNMNVLVSNTVRYNIAIDPQAPGMTSAKIDTICVLLGRTTETDAATYRQKIKRAPRGSRYIVMGKNLPMQVFEALQPLGYRGLIIEEQFRRRYNYDSLAAHVLGYVNRDVRGQDGLEKRYDVELRGLDGLQQVQRDRANNIRAVVGAPRKKPVDGYSLITTLDLRVQSIVDEELRKGVIFNNAKHGSAIVMDPRTGEILAMSNYPTYNPNWPGDEGENRRNFAISDQIEPGSTFKIVTAVAAVEQQKVSFSEIFHTPKDGKKLVHGQWLRDHDPLGSITFAQVIQKSSNVATAEIALRLSKETLYQYARNLGFSALTQIDLPNEESGHLRKPFEWSGVSQPWIAMGYEVQATPLQVMQAYAAFANQGRMMRPYVVKQVIDGSGNVKSERKPEFVRQVARLETIEKLRPVFEGVVGDSGTAALARMKGIKIAGKTGTAQKFMDGRYQAKYRSSFVGFFPSENPSYIALVLLEEPKRSIYGGWVCGPIFRRISERIAGMDRTIIPIDPTRKTELAVLPSMEGFTREEASALLGSLRINAEFEGRGEFITAQSVKAGSRLNPGETVSFVLGSNETPENTTDVIVPSVTGLSVRQAVQQLLNAGLEVDRSGFGLVVSQSIKEGTRVQRGTRIAIRGKAASFENMTSEAR
jgi:cell division protein FtsI (penicillin-binding protein 3)